MGCGASSQVPGGGGDPDLDDEDAPRKPSVVLKTLQGGSSPMQLVVDANGDKAVVQILDDSLPDEVLFNAAMRRAEDSAAAAVKGALRSSMRHPDFDLEQLRNQTRVLKLSLQPKGEADGGEALSSERTVCLRVVPA